MTFEQLQEANGLIRTTDIKGKDYAEVNQRIKAFRYLYPNGEISTEIVSTESGVVVFKATISDGEGNILGQGHAYEKENSSFINKTSYIENCETSAVGRALAMCGIGIDTSIASYEEVANAVKNQNKDIVSESAPEIICPKCGKQILATMLKGKKRTPQEIINTLHMCPECYRAGQR